MKDMISLGLRHENNRLLVLDQQKLPHEEVWISCNSPKNMAALIYRLAVRGAPLIGVAAALSLARFVEDGASKDELFEAARLLKKVRPTAVNLMAAVDRVMLNPERVIRVAEQIFDEDVLLCESMATNGEALIQDGDNILTHCNTGGLATAGIGTALGVIRKAHESGKKIHVFVDETRPLLQGARLTTWELEKLKMPYTLISDNMAAMVLSQGRVQKIFVGSDRIAINGDAANKIGTYSLAVVALYHKIPFYVVAPYTSIDSKCPSGKQIPIEERDAEEVRKPNALKDCQVYNPAFDVTPANLISAFVLDTGVISPYKLVGSVTVS